MLKYFICAFLPASIAIHSCESSRNTNTDQPPISVQQQDIPETPQIQEGMGDTTGNNGVNGNTSNSGEEIQNGTRQGQQQSTKELNKITVSFISIGEGIDIEASENYKSFLDNWKSSIGKSITYETIYWGREGETDFCIDMTNISDSESRRLLSETRERVKNNSLVQIETNQECKVSRIPK